LIFAIGLPLRCLTGQQNSKTNHNTTQQGINNHRAKLLFNLNINNLTIFNVYKPQIGRTWLEYGHVKKGQSSGDRAWRFIRF
jgi:hypothetical protein